MRWEAEQSNPRATVEGNETGGDESRQREAMKEGRRESEKGYHESQNETNEMHIPRVENPHHPHRQ